MSQPNSELYTVQDIPGAGRGVVAKRPISKESPVLRSGPPSAHVVFWEYRKEVCAQCFHYDRGRKLPVRLNSAGKVFCTSVCKSKWLEEQGDVGLESWEQLYKFVQMKSKSITNRASFPLLAPKPAIEKIERSWQSVEEKAKLIRDFRLSAKSDSTAGSKPQRFWTQAEDIDPDILGYLLSGILFHNGHLEQWRSAVVPLAMDATPYRTAMDLEAHCKSFLQLAAVVPVDLLPSVTSELCQTVLNAASHNSFGIRAGGEDGEEYLGYALYPEASYFNHSCRPNIVKIRVGRVWGFRALREIVVGEECCITYLGGDEDELRVGERRERLKRVWGFECMCSRCQQESRSSASST